MLEVVARFGAVAPEVVCAIPLVVRDKTVAVLYADPGIVPNATVDEHSLEIVTTVVSLTVELSSARTKLGVKPQETPAKEAATPAAAPAPPPPQLYRLRHLRYQTGGAGSQATVSAEPAPSRQSHGNPLSLLRP